MFKIRSKGVVNELRNNEKSHIQGRAELGREEDRVQTEKVGNSAE